METKDSWYLLRQIEKIIINYDWQKYGINVCEAYSGWRECYQSARERQLQELGAKSLASLYPDSHNGYEEAMMHRIALVKKCFFDSYVRNKLPKEVCSDFDKIVSLCIKNGTCSSKSII